MRCGFKKHVHFTVPAENRLKAGSQDVVGLGSDVVAVCRHVLRSIGSDRPRSHSDCPQSDVPRQWPACCETLVSAALSGRLAVAYAGLNDADGVFAALEKAYAVRDVNLVFLPVDPKMDPFRVDARFQTLLDRCGFTRTIAST
jgi:hypothetical protein